MAPTSFQGHRYPELYLSLGQLARLYPGVQVPSPDLVGETEEETSTPTPAPSTPCLIRKDFDVLDFFRFNDPTLRKFHITEIRAIAQRISHSLTGPAPIKDVRIVGHTDDRGPNPFNQDLGKKRAQAAAWRLGIELSKDRSKVRITVDSKGPTEPALANSFDRGRACNRRVELFYGSASGPCAGFSFRRFFTEYDLRSEPGDTIGVGANPNMTPAAKAERRSDVGKIVPVLLARRDAKAAIARGQAAPGPIPATDLDALRRLSCAQLDLFFEAFPGAGGTFDPAPFREAFELFSNGDLRAPEVGPGVGEPDGGFFFLFAEFAFLCIEFCKTACAQYGKSVSAVQSLWKAAVVWMVQAQEIFMHVYRPAPSKKAPAVSAPLPAACNPPRRTLDDYKFGNFSIVGQSSPARRSDLNKKYGPFSFDEVKKAMIENLLRAQCMP